MKEWFASSPVSSVLGIILVIALVVVALKLLKTITKPLFITLVVVAVVLLAFNVIDLAFLSATGQKFLSFIWDKITGAAVDAASSAAEEILSNADLPSLR